MVNVLEKVCSSSLFNSCDGATVVSEGKEMVTRQYLQGGNKIGGDHSRLTNSESAYLQTIIT